MNDNLSVACKLSLTCKRAENDYIDAIRSNQHVYVQYK